MPHSILPRQCVPPHHCSVGSLCWHASILAWRLCLVLVAIFTVPRGAFANTSNVLQVAVALRERSIESPLQVAATKWRARLATGGVVPVTNKEGIPQESENTTLVFDL